MKLGTSSVSCRIGAWASACAVGRVSSTRSTPKPECANASRTAAGAARTAASPPRPPWSRSRRAAGAGARWLDGDLGRPPVRAAAAEPARNPGAVATAPSRLFDHGRAEVDAHDIRALVGQPLTLRARSAAGVEHGRSGERLRDERSQRGPFEQPVVGALVGRLRPHRREAVVRLAGQSCVLVALDQAGATGVECGSPSPGGVACGPSEPLPLPLATAAISPAAISVAHA
jgi:hypothetical protein